MGPPEMIQYNGARSICAVGKPVDRSPIGAKHRLENPGTIPLEIIEVQSGSYLAKDDIMRYQDIYNRHQGK